MANFDKIAFYGGRNRKGKIDKAEMRAAMRVVSDATSHDGNKGSDKGRKPRR